GALSPPIASNDIARLALTPYSFPAMSVAGLELRCLSLGALRNDFTTVVMTAGAANMMRTLQFAAIRALGRRGHSQRMVAATHVATRLADFFLGDCHDPLSSKKTRQ